MVPVGYVPMRDVDETVAMIRNLAKLGFRTINIPAFPQAKDGPNVGGFNAQALALTGNIHGDRSYLEPEFDKLWKTITELDITVTMHLGGRIPRFGNKQHFLPDLVMSKTAMAEPVPGATRRRL